jgi:hypothetical protein
VKFIGFCSSSTYPYQKTVSCHLTSLAREFSGNCPTINAPVTITKIPPCGLDGCASLVSTLCCTFLNGRLCPVPHISITPLHLSSAQTGMLLTVSFSMIFPTPATAALSNVSIELSRCKSQESGTQSVGGLGSEHT